MYTTELGKPDAKGPTSITRENPEQLAAFEARVAADEFIPRPIGGR
jgi:hypothetical protein